MAHSQSGGGVGDGGGNDIITNPTIGSGPLAPSVADLVSRDDLDALNREAGNPNQSRRLEGSLEFVQNLLKADKITKFQFKAFPKVASPNDPSTTSSIDDLSPFTRMVYENTSVAFRYSSPETPRAFAPNTQAMTPKVTKKSPKARARQEPHKVVKHNPASANSQAVAQNKSRIEIHLPTQKELHATSLYATPKLESPTADIHTNTNTNAGIQIQIQIPKPANKPSSSQSVPTTSSGSTGTNTGTSTGTSTGTNIATGTGTGTATIATQMEPEKTSPGQANNRASIRIELPAASFNKEEFAVVPDSPDLPPHLSIKRKRTEHDGNEDPLSTDLNQRELANLAFANLRKYLQDIFMSEDQISAQGAGSSPLIFLTSEDEPTMTITAHDNAHRLIKRAIELGCFRQAPVDDLLRIQNLSEGALKQATSLDFQIYKTWGETEVGLWVQRLPDVEAGLKAARTSLRIMCGGREEKQLYSEDLIQLALNLFRNVMDGVIIPLAELRSSGDTASVFRHLSAYKKVISTLFTASQRLFALMCDLIVSIDVSEVVVNTLEFASSKLIFVENAYTEKDSVIGVQKFDGLRSVAMNMLTQVFLMNPSLRQGIFNGILTSLGDLPVGKQKARQFKLSEGGSIQPVSALLMRLVQASAGEAHGGTEKRRSKMMQSLTEDGADDETHQASGSKNPGPIYQVKTEDYAASEHLTALEELDELSKPLMDTATRNATYVVGFMVERALNATKNGETPYRNLLDMFVEDFTACLDSPDWPAAELLLRILMYMMLQRTDGEKNSAPARNMALELLGIMAAAISRLRSHVRKTAGSFEGSDSDELGRWLADLSLTILEGRSSPDKALNWFGPYRISLEFLQDRIAVDTNLNSAISYLVTDWASQVVGGYRTGEEGGYERDSEYGKTAYRLRNMIDDSKWLSREYSFKSVTSTHAKLSHAIILLRSGFCSSFNHILNILMGSMTTDQATVRSRSLKSINQVLETDPTILDGDSNVIRLILQCSSDTSPQVRDSALGLIGKCISMRPRLEQAMTQTVIERFIDSGIGVRKRAMKLARDIYLGNQSKDVRSVIANALLHRMQDPDEGVRELARQMIEEVWISPFYKEDDSTAFKQSLTDHVALIVQTVKQGNTALILDKVFQTILSPESKFSDANVKVCTRLVANMFDLVNNIESGDPAVPSGKDALQVLMIFAKADPKLFTFEQIRLLQPHIASVSTSVEMSVSRAVVVIYRRVLPQVSSVHTHFLQEVRRELLPAVSKVARTLLDDVVACLWIISGLLQTTEHLARLVCSSLAAIQKIKAMAVKGPLDQTRIRQFDRYSLIVGMAGKHCDLDSHAELFKTPCPKWQGGPVSKLMVDVIIPFASPSQPEGVRKPALDAVGLICQSNPRNFVSANIYTTFQQVFDERNPVLEAMILRSLKEFLLMEEKRSEQAATSATAAKEPVKRDLKVMGSTSFDDVASATTQRFLKEVTRIALATNDEHAFLAMEVLGTINRQGLVHPKETGVTLITLETCPISKISELAYHEHRVLHEKYETVLEREYVKAVQSAFQYQRDVIKDVRGATEDPFTAKLHLLVEVLKISKAKNRTRFLEKFVSSVDFDVTKLDVDQTIPPHVEFSRFIIENIAFFEFVTIGDVSSIVAAMEKIVTNTGSGIAQAIESEVFQVRMDPISASQQPAEGEIQPAATVAPPVDTRRFRQLTAGAMILLALWEAPVAKDLTKAPVKIQGITGDKFWDDVDKIMHGLDSQDLMKEQCRAVVELLNVDNEVKIDDEDELDADVDPQTPDAEEDDEAAHDARGRKRKAANMPGGRKKRARSNSKPRPRGRPRKQQSMEIVEVEMTGNGDWA
ncbi:putative sister chromatid cohesion protein mis4 protein [Eutypa lata UCREL1]|uniref:Sister chromatid cohesion protein n=1 Tax=Eutypa lata (strain UCR-EL1) TaxID=1287681 RepID=M7T4S9_EUTLA|nr:putative sister chromatid cohesion protein mis4 protein [Eutypa lata UCREL1]